MPRQQIRVFLAGSVGLCAFAMLAIAQAPPAAPFITHQLTTNVYWVEGGGGNSGVIIGDKGVIVVDAKTTPAGGKELLDDIAKITPKPVTTVILTHSDGDHVNGLASFPAGITIIAHENNKKEQEAALAAGGRGAPPADHLPTRGGRRRIKRPSRSTAIKSSCTIGRRRTPAAIWWSIFPPKRSCSPATSSRRNCPTR